MASLITSYHFLYLFFFFPHLSASSVTHLCSHHEATALIHFKNSFSIIKTEFTSLLCDDIAGLKSYPKTNSWKEGTDCCSWDGVTCDHLNAHVIALDLSCSWLYGNFPSNSTLFLLPYIQKLNLAYNDFNYSKMPFEFGQFTRLVYLNISETLFAGKVPSQISHLSKLVSLDLSHNVFFDQLTLDKNILEGLVHNLTEVRHLFLDRIIMPSINPNVFMNLSSSIKSLSLGGCDLQGKFPSNILHSPNLNLLNLGYNRNLSLDLLKFNQSSNLEHLDLSWMSFTKLIDSIDNLHALKYLDLSHSNLRGSISRSLGNLLQLTYLDLSWNQLSGQVPLSILNLTQLQHLRIAENSLEGSIPDEVAAFPNLISLDLSNNLLNGKLPSWLYTASSLMEIYLSQNQFSGHIKEFQSKSLEMIVLGNNKLQGPLPSSIFQSLNLTWLLLYSNNLSGVIEFSMFSNLPNLEYLDLSQNSLSLSSNNVSQFPPFLKGSKKLKALDLSNNRIEGKIPQWLQKVTCDSLSYLNLSHNSLTEVEQLPWKNINILDLSSNLIHGNLPIPSSTINVFLISNNSLGGEISSLICNVSALQVLDLSHNKLIGTIPQCFGNLSNTLEFLNLKKNKFYGMILPTFAKGCQLSYLNLNGNQFEGPLSPSILNCRSLEVLDLGNNKINDTFPHWLGSLPRLQVLVLKSNQMHGSLHDHSSKSSPCFSKIQIFDLSSNYFSGPLPGRYINSFKAIINLTKDASTMTYMGVQDVNGSGGFYSYSIGIVMKGQDIALNKIFVMWAIIDLSNNKFDGEIPKVIGKLGSLKGLNLSHNNLNGYIPTSIGSLTNLEWLDLSSNKLVGWIPRELLNLAALSMLNLSMNELVGCIPQGKQFNTFGNTSYEGNKGLHGFPLSSDCNNNEQPPPSNLSEEGGLKSNIDFGWKVVLLGYGCGVVLGLGVGYVVFQTGKPKWIVSLVEDHIEKRRRRKPMTGNRSNGGRRI
ncbi:hypothetical protein ES288_D05G453100v1 [Gossypium darwinii]|nr:hypothetical protein ES288_D05G453100v1 [Gossypium darwinii]